MGLLNARSTAPGGGKTTGDTPRVIAALHELRRGFGGAETPAQAIDRTLVDLDRAIEAARTARDGAQTRRTEAEHDARVT